MALYYGPYGKNIMATITSQRPTATDRWSIGVAKKKAQDEWQTSHGINKRGLWDLWSMKSMSTN